MKTPDFRGSRLPAIACTQWGKGAVDGLLAGVAIRQAPIRR
jgi:hypothetical protein